MTPAEPRVTLFRVLLPLLLASRWAAPASVTVPPVMVPLARVNEPVGLGPASVRASVAPVLVSVVEMFTVPAVWLTVPSWAVVNAELKFRVPPETTRVPALFRPALTLTVPPVGAITWPPARLFRAMPKFTMSPLRLAWTVPLFWNAPLPWKVLIFKVLLVAPAAKPRVLWLSRTVAALEVSRFAPRVTLFRMLLPLLLASRWAAPASVTVPPVMVPLARVNEPVGLGPASVRASVAPVLVSVVEMFTVPAVWLTAPSWAVVNAELKFRVPPETTRVPALFRPALTLTVPPVGAITWPPARLFRAMPKLTVSPLALAWTVPLFWNAPLPWKVLIFRVLLVAAAAKPRVLWLSRTVAALEVSRFTPRVALMPGVPTVTELP